MKDIASPYRVIAVGKTGSGKSSILNSLTHSKHFGKRSSDIYKDTDFLTQKFKGRFTSPEITFVDTPGFSDNSSRDNEAIAKIATTLRCLESGLNLVLFCFPAYEIRQAPSMSAGWKFLRLILTNANYEHLSIILTHGNKLSSHELEEAIARMTTEFIPYIKETLKFKVKEEILIYEAEGKNDGLDGVLGYITSSREYRSGVTDDLGKFWSPENPLRSVEYLLQNSRVFNEIQDLVLGARERDEWLEDEVRRLKEELKSVKVQKEKEVKEGIEKVSLGYQEKIQEELRALESFKSDIGAQIKQMKEELENKDKKIETLTKQLEELKASSAKKDAIATGVRNQYLQFDAKRNHVRTARNYTDRSELLPGNYHIAPAAEKCSDKHLAKVIEAATRVISSPKPNEGKEEYRHVQKYSTPNQTKKTPLVTQQSLGMKWVPCKVPVDSQQSVRTQDSKTVGIPPRPPEKNLYKYAPTAYSQPKFAYATPQIMNKQFETSFRLRQYEN